MPTDTLSLPPIYTFIGLYRLCTDASIREPVLAKVKHAAVRGAVVGAVYAVFGWSVMGWVVKRFVVGKSRVGERVTVGGGAFSISVDLVLYTHLFMLLENFSAILKFFVKKNLRIARARAYDLTVASRRKPKEFWSLGYVEEWQQPPVPTREQQQAWGSRRHQEKWLSWALWWPTQMVLRQFILLPLSPNLPFLAPLVVSSLRALQTAETLHRPYFVQKHMSSDEVWRWMEERKWAYRAFGYAAAFLESLPIAGMFFSISNRIGAAMWAHDLEKRQHLFAHHILQPLPPSKVGLFGTGTPMDITQEVRAAQSEIEQRWSARPAFHPLAEDDSARTALLHGDDDDTDMGPPPEYSASSATAGSAAGSRVAPAPPVDETVRRRVPPPLPPRNTRDGL